MSQPSIELEIKKIVQTLFELVHTIDLECNTPLNNIEHGLANVKLEFRQQAKQEIGKSLGEENLIAWLVHKKLKALGYESQLEVAYPAPHGRKKCDLVIPLNQENSLWLELKLAWKAWFNCAKPPQFKNGWYRPYLQGSDRSHAFLHDFAKLHQANLPQGCHPLVCLIGFDHHLSPIAPDIAALLESLDASQVGVWQQIAQQSWPDRRCSDFRINLWCWKPEAATSKIAGAEIHPTRPPS